MKYFCKSHEVLHSRRNILKINLHARLKQNKNNEINEYGGLETHATEK
jgi:hypothetical protein